jgi:hypothetical protein
VVVAKIKKKTGNKSRSSEWVAEDHPMVRLCLCGIDVLLLYIFIDGLVVVFFCFVLGVDLMFGPGDRMFHAAAFET